MYCGLVKIQIRIAKVNTTAAVAPMMIVFCFAVNWFHHANIFCNISLILSGMIFSPYLQISLDLHQICIFMISL